MSTSTCDQALAQRDGLDDFSSRLHVLWHKWLDVSCEPAKSAGCTARQQAMHKLFDLVREAQHCFGDFDQWVGDLYTLEARDGAPGWAMLAQNICQSSDADELAQDRAQRAFDSLSFGLRAAELSMQAGDQFGANGSWRCSKVVRGDGKGRLSIGVFIHEPGSREPIVEGATLEAAFARLVAQAPRHPDRPSPNA